MTEAIHAWSPAARSVWAKTGGDALQGLPLVQHLVDAAGVAGDLWDHWLAPNVKRIISEGLPDGESDGRIWLTWLAGIHDIGKATPGFAIKATRTRGRESEHLWDVMRDHGLVAPPEVVPGKLAPHCRVGHWLAVRWLRANDFGVGAASWISPVGAHHGVPPTFTELEALDGDTWTGSRIPSWTAVQEELLESMARITGARERLPAWAASSRPLTAQVMASAAVIVADWLASDESRFPYTDLAAPDRLDRAGLAEALLGPWRPATSSEPDAAELGSRFRARFPWLADPNDVQREVVRAADAMTEPGLLVLEAPMGSGKTEAALMAAEVLAAKFGAGGVFVALPTMATSDAMFGRVHSWIEHLPTDAPSSVYLAHGRAHLNDTYRGLVADARFRGVNVLEDESDSDGTGREPVAVVTSWLQNRRRGVLANIVVGTIDQILMSALGTRYLALRHLGVVGKVVIVDEVHAADAYMREYLKRALEWLGAYGVPVILLSATLPPAQREDLCRAYQAGRVQPPAADMPVLGSLRVKRQPVAPPPSEVTPADAAVSYPTLRTVGGSVVATDITWTGRRLRVTVERLDDSLPTLVEAIAPHVENGACVVVIRNTVVRAQQAYVALADRVGRDRTLLVHSRFPASERAHRESHLVQQLGPPRDDVQRPRGLVVVGTQVLEQSLDIDADLLVTDLGPIDLVLQRIGRLHRHDRGDNGRPIGLDLPRVLVTGVADWAATPPLFVSGSEAVYGRANLLRSLAVLSPYLDSADDAAGIEIPADIPGLVKRAYDPVLVAPAGWTDALAEADQEHEREVSRAIAASNAFRLKAVHADSTLIGWLAGRADDDSKEEGRAQVRDSEDSLEVILVWQDADGDVRLLPGDAACAEAPLGLPDVAPPEGRLALAAAASTVRLPVAMTRFPRQFDAVIRDLETRRPHFTGWQESGWLRGNLVLCLDADLRAVLAGWTLSYHPTTGLSAARTEGPEA